MRQVALTFDDGPHPRWTREILDVLSENPGTNATFFIWGEQAQQHSDVVTEAIRAGHSVQPHCWHHVAHWDLDAVEIRADIDRVLALLGELGVSTPRLWRPPWGRLRGTDTSRIAEERDLELAGWTIDTHDWAGHAGAELYTDVKAQIIAAPGEVAVVLMHDSYVEAIQAAHRSDCAATVELVRRMIDDDELTFTPLLGGLADNLREQRDRPTDGTWAPSPGYTDPTSPT
jgi:peptidoglycan/xylan/chitin deacetylase (PgdA/CDA1 family)